MATEKLINTLCVVKPAFDLRTCDIEASSFSQHSARFQEVLSALIN